VHPRYQVPTALATFSSMWSQAVCIVDYYGRTAHNCLGFCGHVLFTRYRHLNLGLESYRAWEISMLANYNYMSI